MTLFGLLMLNYVKYLDKTFPDAIVQKDALDNDQAFVRFLRKVGSLNV